MLESCGNCENLIYREGYIYPYCCDKNKSIAFTRDEVDKRISVGYSCDKYVMGFYSTKTNKVE